MHDAFEGLSIASTFPGVMIWSLVAYVFWQPVSRALRKAISRRERLTERDWLLLGITISAISSLCDQTYWAIPWSLSFTRSEHTESWMQAGVYSNLPIRQGLGIIAGLLHLQTLPKSRRWQQCVWWSVVAGVLYTLALLLLKE